MKIVLILVLVCYGTVASAQTALYESGNAFVRFCAAADKVLDISNGSDSDIQHTLNWHALRFRFRERPQSSELGFPEMMTGKDVSKTFCVQMVLKWPDGQNL